MSKIVEFKNPVVTVLLAWAAERTIKFVVKQLTTPEWDKACALVRSNGYDIVPKAKKEEEDLEMVDPEVVEDQQDGFNITLTDTKDDVSLKEEK